jgi:hypothetical protein
VGEDGARRQSVPPSTADHMACHSMAEFIAPLPMACMARATASAISGSAAVAANWSCHNST